MPFRTYRIHGYDKTKGKWIDFGEKEAESRENAIAWIKFRLGSGAKRFSKFITQAQALNPMKKKANKRPSTKRPAKRAVRRKPRKIKLKSGLTLRPIPQSWAKVSRKRKAKKTAPRKKNLFTSRKRAAAKAQKLRAKAAKLEKHAKRPTLRQRIGRKIAGNPKGKRRNAGEVSSYDVEVSNPYLETRRFWIDAFSEAEAKRKAIQQYKADFYKSFGRGLNSLNRAAQKQTKARVVKKSNPPKRNGKTVIKAKRVLVMNGKGNPRKGTRHMSTARKLSRSKDQQTAKTGRQLLAAKTKALRAKRRKRNAVDWMKRMFITGSTQPSYTDKSKRGGGHKAAIRAWRKKYGTPHPHEIEAARGKKMSAAEREARYGPKKRNGAGSVKRIHQKFLGRRSDHVQAMKAPHGTPKDVAIIGRRLVSFKLRGKKQKLKFGPGGIAPKLAADGRGKLHVVGGRYRFKFKDGRRRNPEQIVEIAPIEMIEYEAVKDHLDGVPVTYFHHFGEEGGELPMLGIDGEGLAHIIGGSYKLQRVGIRD